MNNKPRGRRSQQESARTRSRILGRAERLFAKRGYRAVSLREIATASGVRPFTIQHHFGSKAGLYQAVLSRWNDEVRALLERAVADQTTLGDAIENVVEELFDFFLAHRDWIAVTARAALGEGVPKGVALAGSSWIRFIDQITQERSFGSLKLDLGMLLITVEGILNNHVLARAHYRQLYGKDVTDPRIKARAKDHLKKVILALVDASR